MSASAIVRQPGAGEPNRAFGLPRRFVVTAEETGGAFSTWIETVPPRSGPPLHRHRREQELFHVTRGRLLFACADERVELGPGGFLLVPTGAPHSFLNAGDVEAEAIITVTPGGLEGLFREVERCGLVPPADMAAIVAIAERYHLEFVGPPLEP